MKSSFKNDTLSIHEIKCSILPKWHVPVPKLNYGKKPLIKPDREKSLYTQSTKT